MRVRFLEGGFKYLFPPAETSKLRFYHFAAQANCRIAFFLRKLGKLMPVFVASWKMGQ